MNMQNYKKLTLISIIISTILINIVKADESMLKNKPYFTLRIDTKGARYEAKLNGIEVLRDVRNGNMLNTEVPVNQYMKSSENIISLNLFPKRDDGFNSANISLSLYVNKDEAPESEKKLLSNIVFTGAENIKGTGIESSMPAMRLDSTDKMKKSDNGDVIVHSASIAPAKIMSAAVTVSQKIELETPFPRWGYLDGDVLDFPENYNDYLSNKDLYKKNIINPLFQEYQNIYNLLASNDIDAVMDLFKERNHEYDIAYYYPEGTYDKKLRDSLAGDLKFLKLLIRDSEKAAPMMSDNKRLFKLGNVGMIYFTNDEKSTFNNYDIIFYKKDGKWIVSR